MTGLYISLGIIFAIALALYIANLKDVYFALGQAVAMKHHADAKITYDQHGGVRIEFPNGFSENYCGHLGSSVLKILKKKGVVTDKDFAPLASATD
ncbi:hypothetical protein [Neptuniibacter sp. QD37_11]|uniref:hypothetical protein n=1 Tax=Neptuniibacter sp. QD37_11 TaxID=3398209 RepID=UPI0039F59BC6